MDMLLRFSYCNICTLILIREYTYVYFRACTLYTVQSTMYSL